MKLNNKTSRQLQKRKNREETEEAAKSGPHKASLGGKRKKE